MAQTVTNKLLIPLAKGLALDLDQLYTLIRKDTGVKELISPHVAYYLAQMAVASVCIS